MENVGRENLMYDLTQINRLCGADTALIREILNFENSLCGNILIINAENLLMKKIKLNKNKNCIKKIE